MAWTKFQTKWLEENSSKIEALSDSPDISNDLGDLLNSAAKLGGFSEELGYCLVDLLNLPAEITLKRNSFGFSATMASVGVYLNELVIHEEEIPEGKSIGEAFIDLFIANVEDEYPNAIESIKRIMDRVRLVLDF